MAVPTLIITDDESNVYTFPKDFWISDESVLNSKNVVNRTYASGGRDTADGFLQAKNVIVSGALRADSLGELETKKRAFFTAMLKGGELKYSDDTVSRYIDVRSPDFAIRNGYRFEVIISVTFLAAVPFWTDAAVTTDTTVVTGDKTFTVDGSESDFIMFPVIEVENDQLVDNPGIRIVNESDGGMEFVYNDAKFYDGDLLVVDSEAGTVKKNNNNAIANFDPGRFLRLQPLENSIRYEGAAATIRFKFRKVYVI